jgi:nitrogenase molybdenum-iron protein alpha/beta subunit
VPQKERTTVEDFALKGNHLARMTGISVAVHAIPDGFLLMHTGVGCKYKTAAQVAPHDWAEHPNRREAWTQVGEVQLIRGSAARIAPFARAWYERRRPTFMQVVSAYFIELTGEDCRDVVGVTEKTVPCDMAMLTTAAPNGGFYSGYADVTLEVAKRIDWKAPVTPGTAAVLGYWFDRYEGDHKGNLSQLRTLLRVCGLDTGPVLLSGTPYTELQQAGSAEHLLMLPYMGKRARKVKRTTKRTPIPLDLPMSLAGTSYFLRTLARATGADTRRVESYIEAQSAHARKQLAAIVHRMRGVSLAIFAEGPLAAGLYALCTELGLTVPVVGIRESFLGGKTGFIDILDRWGVPLSPDTEVIEQPSLRWTREHIGQAIVDGRIHGVVGSAHETNLFLQSPYRPGMERRSEHYFTIQVGFPSDEHHVSVPLPLFGYTGAMLFAQRIFDTQPRAV